MTKKIVVILTFFTSILNLNIRADNHDTLKLYRNKCGMRYNIYKWQLFYVKSTHSYSYNPWTEQDIFFENSVENLDYCVFFDRLNKKQFEGPMKNGMFQGPVTFYYKNGRVKRIEHYGYEKGNYWDSEFNWSDAPYEKGTWEYFRRSGKLYKQRQYLTLQTMDSATYYRICITSYYRKKIIFKTRTTYLEVYNIN